jgi:rubredoxin
MKCTLCGHEFNESEAQAGCTACSVFKKCDLVMCPNCNFEMVPDPEWIKRLKAKKKENKK